MTEIERINSAAETILETMDAAKREVILAVAETEARRLLSTSPHLNPREIDRRAQAYTIAVADRANELMTARQLKSHNAVGNA